VNGQEQPVGPATLADGGLVTAFSAYQPRTFAIRLGAAPAQVSPVRSTPVTLHYDAATASNDGTAAASGFDGKGHALPAEMLPDHISFSGVKFQLPPAKTGTLNAVVAKGQAVDLPAGKYNRVYILAASADGDQDATFQVGSQHVSLNVQDWRGFIGQWDDRQWIAKDAPIPGQPGRTEHDDYAQMTGIRPGYIKRADLAWYCSHQHDAAGVNMPYQYSYLFGYRVELPDGAKTITLPHNDKIRVLAVSVAEENPEIKPAQPLYDVLPPAQREPAK
jgi:alpha-mannosidase